MKPSLHFHILAAIFCSSLGLAGEERVLPAPDATTARILGNLPDGTPPPPEPLKPKFIVPARDILESKSHEQGGRTITVRKIAPIALPPPPEAPAPIDLNDPAVQQRIAERRANHPGWKLLLVGATVYHSKDGPARTLVRIWPQAQGEPITVWSSADFSLLSGIPTFTVSSGETAMLMMAWSVTNLDNANATQRKFARQFAAPAIPEFAAGKANFVITEGNPTEETLVSIRSLHDIYNNEHDRLLAAYQGREQARLAQENERAAHSPKPKDIVINYWLTDSADQANGKGAAR